MILFNVRLPILLKSFFLDDVGTNAKQGRRSEIIHLADANCDRFK